MNSGFRVLGLLALCVVHRDDAHALPMEVIVGDPAVYGVNEIGSQAFDDNLGGDTQLFATLVGGFTLTGPELVIQGTPFLFDPSQGNLLLDIRVSGAPLGHTGPFFAALGPGNAIGDGTVPFSRWHDFGICFDDRGLAVRAQAAIPAPHRA